MKSFKNTFLLFLVLAGLVPLQAQGALLEKGHDAQQPSMKVKVATAIAGSLVAAGAIDCAISTLPTWLVVKLGKWDARPACELVKAFVQEKLAEIGVTESIDLYESASMDKIGGFAISSAHLICLPAYLGKLLKSLKLCSELINALEKGDACSGQLPLVVTFFGSTFKANNLDELIQLKKYLGNELNKMVFLIQHEGTHIKHKDSCRYLSAVEGTVYCTLFNMPSLVVPTPLTYTYSRSCERRADEGVHFNPEVLEAGIEMWHEAIDSQESYFRTDEEDGSIVQAIKGFGRGYLRCILSLYTHPLCSERIENIQKRLDEHKQNAAQAANNAASAVA